MRLLLRELLASLSDGLAMRASNNGETMDNGNPLEGYPYCQNDWNNPEISSSASGIKFAAGVDFDPG